MYHRLSSDPDDGYLWYGDDRLLVVRFNADVREFAGQMLCQDCRKPYEDAQTRNEKITRKNAQLEASGQKRLPGF